MQDESKAAVADGKGKIRAFLASSFRSHQFADDEDIFESGVVNSMFALQLVIFVEKQFSIQLDDGDLDLDNFRSINAIDQLVAGKSPQDQG